VIGGYWEGILVILSINVILAYSAFLPLSAGQLNLGIAGFMAIGAYVSAWFSNEYGVFALGASLIGSAAAGVVAFALGFPVLRARAAYLAIATLALGEVVRGTAINLKFIGAAAGYPVTAYLGLPVIGAMALLVIAFVSYLYSTRFGLSVVAVEDDERVADLLGLNVRRIRVWAFAIGGALAGLGGALYAHHFSFIEGQSFTVLLSVYIVLYVILGGVQSVLGPLFGAAFFTLLPELFRMGKEWRYVLFAAAVILLMAWRPQGMLTANPIAQWLRRSHARG
jgi:branched-chain amino acid transport system permease protein